MPTSILIKRSSTASAVPTTSDIQTGELAINTVDKRIFTNNNGAIVELGTYPSSQAVQGNATVGGTLVVTGATTLATGSVTDWTVTGTLTVSTPSNSTDAARKDYVDSADALKLNKAGDTMSGALAMGNNKITGLATPTAGTDAATKAYVDAQVNAVLDNAPAALDTLNELAAAINDDANFASTITTALGTKLSLSGGTMAGNIVMGANAVTSTATPTTADTLTRKGYVDTQDALKVAKAGDTMTGTLNMGANKVTTTADPVNADDLARKGYVDTILGSATAAATSATASATSASEAATSASNAATSATASSVSASSSATSATNAATSATASASSATSASNSATSAASSATAAAASAANAAAAYDSFDDRYLGSKTSDPTLDNDGNALVTGALYYNSTTAEMRIYDGSLWIAASSASIETMEKFNFTATNGQTVFTGSDDNARTLTMTVGVEIVTLNGIVLESGTDYTSTADTITLTTGASTGDELNVFAFGNFTVADTVSASLGGTFQNDIEVVGAVTTEGLTVDAPLGRELILLKRGGTHAGTIGLFSYSPYIGRGDTSIRFDLFNGDSKILPCDSDGYSQTDTIDLGSSSTRFKDLYLSGGVYLGGTGSATPLDDYEEGVFTPVAIGTSTAGTGTYLAQAGYYTKVGNVVNFTIDIAWTAHTGTGNLYIQGLPFTQSNSSFFYNVHSSGLSFNGNTNVNGRSEFAGSSRIILLSFSSGTNHTFVGMDSAIGTLQIAGYYTTA